MAQKSQADLKEGFQAAEAHEMFNTLGDEEVWQLLDYVRTFSFVVPQRNGVLLGQVTNGTTGEPQGNVEVRLYGFQGDTQVEELTAQADNEGHFTFENLATEHSISYLVEGTYQDITYVSQQPAVFTPDSTETNLSLEVYETTADQSVLSVTQLHFLVSFAPGSVNVAQVFVVGNNSNRSYMGENGQTFTFSLPPQAADVTFQNDPAGDRFVETENGYADTEPVVPGPQGSSVVAVYAVPYDGDTLEIDVPVPATVVSANVLMQDVGVKLNSEQLQFAEARSIQGQNFAIYNGTSLPAGQNIKLTLAGLNDLDFTEAGGAGAVTPGLVNVDQGLLRWIIIGLGGAIIVLAAAVYPYLRPQLTHQAGLDAADPDTRRQQLLLLLARLDETYEAGELDEQVYRRARARYKAELAELLA
jgi:hypothetical protein